MKCIFFFWFVNITVTPDLEPIPPSPTTLAQFGFKRMSVVSPVKTKYSAEELKKKSICGYSLR